MFVAERLVYLQLQKTGNSHIAKLLVDLIPGEEQGRHNRLERYDLYRDRSIVGSIRNPWDWYVSLWAYCCSRRGDWYINTTAPIWRSVKLRYHLRLGTNGDSGSGPLLGGAVRSFCHNTTKAARRWRDLYADSDDPKLFREFLRTLFGQGRYDFCDGYGISSVSTSAGLLTYYYLKLHSREAAPLFVDPRLSDPDALSRFDRENNILNSIIRLEHLEDDLIRALATAGYGLTPGQESKIRAARGDKFNRSEHRAPAYYYDCETFDLVRSRDRLLVEKYAYEQPSAD